MSYVYIIEQYLYIYCIIYTNKFPLSYLNHDLSPKMHFFNLQVQEQLSTKHEPLGDLVFL